MVSKSAKNVEILSKNLVKITFFVQVLQRKDLRCVLVALKKLNILESCREIEVKRFEEGLLLFGWVLCSCLLVKVIEVMGYVACMVFVIHER